MAAFAELLREIGEDIGEDFAFASLRAADQRQPNPGIGLFRQVRRGPGVRMHLRVVLFQDVERVAVMELHADGA